MPTAPVRFIILSRGRTGSTLLQQLLDSHPDCVCFEEVFAPRPLPPLPADYPAAEGDAYFAATDLRAVDPVSFLNRHVYAGFAPNIAAVGFKLLYQQSRTGDAASLWPYLQAMPGLRVLHSRRSNLLRMWVSTKIAAKTGAWWSLDGEPDLAQKRVVVNPAVFVSYVAEVESARAAGDEAFADHPMLQLEYEAFSRYEPGNPAMDATLDFLGLRRLPLPTPMKRQNPEPLRDLIANFDEVKAYLAGTYMESFLDD